MKVRQTNGRDSYTDIQLSDKGVSPLVPGRFPGNFLQVIFKLILLMVEAYQVKFSQDLSDDNYKSTLVLLMAWYCQARSQYLNQCWSSFVLPYNITRSQLVKFHFLATINYNGISLKNVSQRGLKCQVWHEGKINHNKTELVCCHPCTEEFQNSQVIRVKLKHKILR